MTSIPDDHKFKLKELYTIHGMKFRCIKSTEAMSVTSIHLKHDIVDDYRLYVDLILGVKPILVTAKVSLKTGKVLYIYQKGYDIIGSLLALYEQILNDSKLEPIIIDPRTNWLPAIDNRSKIKLAKKLLPHLNGIADIYNIKDILE